MQTREELIEQLPNLQKAIAEGYWKLSFKGRGLNRTLDKMRRIELGFMQILNGKPNSIFKKIVSVFEKF